MISNGISLLLLLLAIRRPVTARISLSLIFIAAALFNGIAAFMHPEWYLSYANIAAIPLYERIITGAFSEHVTAYVLAIAIGQLCIGIFIGYKGPMQKLALIGAIIFLLAIAPLGAGSAFPCSLLLATACLVLLCRKSTATFREIRA
jgi:hypothetical protein